MKKRIIMLRKVVTLLFLSIGLSTTSAEEIILKVHHFLGEDSLPHRSLIEPWARRIEDESTGRIKVEVYPAMTLGGKAPELVNQVSEGVVDIIWTAAAYTPGLFPRSEVFTLPLVHKGDPVVTNLAIMETIEYGVSQDFEGLHPLLVHVQSGHALHLGEKPVTRMEDLKGMILRPAGRGISLWTIDALGAAPTKKRHPKLPKALEESALDGAFMSFQLAHTMGVIDAVKSHTMLEGKDYFGTSLYLFLMNKARYDSLPDDLQTVIDRNSGSVLAREAGRAWRQAENAGIETARARGNTINILKDEQQRIRKALEKVLIHWAKKMEVQRIDGLRLIKEARRAIARNRQVMNSENVTK